MAERSGDPAVDQLISDYMARGWSYPDWEADEGSQDERYDINELRTPENATGMCTDVAEDFARFAISQGFEASVVPDTDLDLTHEVTLIKHDGRGWWVDFTHAQFFGEPEEFPMVRPA